MKKEQIILIGGGGHCKSCIDVIELEGRFQIAGILDVKEKVGQKILKYTIIGTDENIPTLVKEKKSFFITVGHIKNPAKRFMLYEKLKKYNIELPVIISPLAHVSKHATIKEGTIIMHQALVGADAIIGVNCIINNKSNVEHDAVIGNHCHISTGAIINGGVKVGSKTFFGSGAISKEYIEIPPDSFIKANSLVK